MRWRRRQVQPGLNTAADAARFVAEIHALPGVLADPEPPVVPDEPVREVIDLRTPIYDRLLRETYERWTAERVAAVFAELVADWRCTACGAQVHGDCPGCSCPCGVVVDA